MSTRADDPRCPECGEPIGQTATYCMHCSADLTDERAAADADGNGVWDESGPQATEPGEATLLSGDRPLGIGERAVEYARRVVGALGRSSPTDTAESGHLLAPEGLVDNTLTAVVGIVGGFVVGLVGTIVLGIVTGSPWALAFGLVAWLGATAYLVRRRTVQDAVAKSGYAITVVLLLVPVIALSPAISVDGGIGERGSLLLLLLIFVAVPAGIAATIGWIASRFVPDDGIESEG